MSDPVEAAMEEALRPGRYIPEHASFSLVSELESVAARIAGATPERAVGLYETFIAACYEKADEVDDSSGYFGTFGGSLFSRWVTARQAASADPADTAARLLTWMANDQYGFWSHVEDDIASALDEAGRAACAGHLERLLGAGTDSAFIRRQLDKLLRAVYIAQRDADAYTALAERSGLTAGDCLAMATILGPARGPGAHEPLPQGRLHPRVRGGSRGHGSRARANLPGEGPRPLGSAGLTSPMPCFGTLQGHRERPTQRWIS